MAWYINIIFWPRNGRNTYYTIELCWLSGPDILMAIYLLFMLIYKKSDAVITIPGGNLMTSWVLHGFLWNPVRLSATPGESCGPYAPRPGVAIWPGGRTGSSGSLFACRFLRLKQIKITKWLRDRTLVRDRVLLQYTGAPLCNITY